MKPKSRVAQQPPGVGMTTPTDLPVLLPVAGETSLRAQGARREGTWRLELKAWHGWVLVAVFVVGAGVTEAQSEMPLESGSLATLWRWIPFIMWKNGNGFVLNLVISLAAMAIGTVTGALLGVGRVSELRSVRGGSWFVTQFFRNSPWLVLLFFTMFIMPFEIELDDTILKIPDWIKAAIALSLPIMANIAEIVRGAVNSVPVIQWESAESLAFSRRQILRMIIFPQIIKRMIPPWMNWYAILTMSTPLASVLGVEECVFLTAQAMVAENSNPTLLFPFYGFVLIVFFLYCYPIARWTMRLERKYAVRN